MSPHTTNVLLLREPSPPPTPDRYELTFISAGYNPISVPVLETLHLNLPALKDIIRDGPEARGFAGVVITSKRSCETWGMALGLLKEGGQHEESLPPCVLSSAGWLRIPFYVVGHGTATALQDAFDFFPTKVDIDIRGESSGNAVTLAPFMLSDIKERPAKILYLTGDKNRDTLTNLLTEGGITLEPLQVYETLGSPRFEEQLLRVLRSPSEEHPPSSWWVAHFAPSAAAFASPILQRYFDFEENLPSTSTLRSDSSDAIPTQAKPAVTTKNSRRAKVAAIGPTTNAFLLDDLGIRVHAMAHKPTPEEILAVIAASDRKTSEL